MSEERTYGDNVWGELEEPGATPGPYHLHHGTDEYLVVLRGTPTLRSHDGERTLAEGDVVPLPPGLHGAHQVRNESDAPIRVAIFAYHHSPDVIEYLDEGVVIVGGRTLSGDGEPLYSRFPPE